MINVLLADDHLAILEGLRHTISATMDLAGTATSGCKALRLARAAPPDALVLDLTMPGADGLVVETLFRPRSLSSKSPTRHVPRLLTK